jgi:hypothetical protein
MATEPEPQPSVAVTKESFAAAMALAQATVASAGNVKIVGAVVLFTVIV